MSIISRSLYSRSIGCMPSMIRFGNINGLGMEPAAISGVYAANRILGLA